MERIRSQLGFHNLFVVESIGKSGGLALLWGEDENVEIQNFSQNHINVVVKTSSNDIAWKLMGFYGQLDVGKCHETWSLLKALASFSPTPWVCLGDFNEILSLLEKWGGSEKSRTQMYAFQQTLEECELSDLGFVGPKYTWKNCRDGMDFIRERLDGGLQTKNGETCSFRQFYMWSLH